MHAGRQENCPSALTCRGCPEEQRRNCITPAAVHGPPPGDGHPTVGSTDSTDRPDATPQLARNVARMAQRARARSTAPPGFRSRAARGRGRGYGRRPHAEIIGAVARSSRPVATFAR